MLDDPSKMVKEVNMESMNGTMPTYNLDNIKETSSSQSNPTSELTSKHIVD